MDFGFLTSWVHWQKNNNHFVLTTKMVQATEKWLKSKNSLGSEGARSQRPAVYFGHGEPSPPKKLVKGHLAGGPTQGEKGTEPQNEPHPSSRVRDQAAATIRFSTPKTSQMANPTPSGFTNMHPPLLEVLSSYLGCQLVVSVVSQSIFHVNLHCISFVWWQLHPRVYKYKSLLAKGQPDV